jgi:hypothetical protein
MLETDRGLVNNLFHHRRLRKEASDNDEGKVIREIIIARCWAMHDSGLRWWREAASGMGL